MSLLSPAYWFLGYLLGSLPFALWITRLVKGIDVRDGGSGHVTTTNTIRQAGWMAGAAVFVLDFGKGFLAVWLALHAGLPAWSVGLTGALAVAGHCWPVFAQFRGGMGLATMGGGLAVVSPLGFLVALGTLIALVLRAGADRPPLSARQCFYGVGGPGRVLAGGPARHGVVDRGGLWAGDRRPLYDRLESQISRVVAGSREEVIIAKTFLAT